MCRKIIFTFYILLTCQSIFGFQNPALDREINDTNNDLEFRTELTRVRSECEKNANLRSTSMYGNNNLIYWYEYIPASAPTDKTIIFLPGGPGANSIGNNFMPKLFNLIQIDPRGVGCNYGNSTDFSVQQMTTKLSALDVVNIIKSENLKKYILYGHSYGKVFATILANSLSKDLVDELPVAVVLEGIFGHYHNSWLEQSIPMANQLSKELDSNIISKLNQWSIDENYNQFIGWLFQQNYDDEKPELLSKFQSTLASFNTKDEFINFYRSYWEDWMQSLKSPPYQANRKAEFTLDTILCQELSKTYEGGRYSIVYSNGRFKAETVRTDYPDRCNTLNFNGYDSKNYQIAQPIYYFQGTRDVSTSIESAEYHFNNQSIAEYKIFNRISNSGHNPLQLRLLPCMGDIFSMIFEKKKVFNSIISSDGVCL